MDNSDLLDRSCFVEKSPFYLKYSNVVYRTNRVRIHQTIDFRTATNCVTRVVLLESNTDGLIRRTGKFEDRFVVFVFLELQID